MCETSLEIRRFAWVTSELIRSLTSAALTGSSSLTRTRTVGWVGFRPPSDSSFVIRSGGRIRAASASPDSTMSRACGLARNRDAVDPRAELAASRR